MRKLLFRLFLASLSLFALLFVWAHIEVTKRKETYNILKNNLHEAIEKNNEAQALELFNNFTKEKFNTKKNLSSILLQAINQDHTELAQCIVQSINSDNDSQHDWEPHLRARYKNDIKNALLAAIRHGHIKIVKELLEKEADPNYKEYGDDSPLLTAATTGKLEIVKELIQKGAHIADTDSYNKTTPLIEAALYGHAEILNELLLSFPEIPLREKNIALLLAAANGHIKIVEALLKSYANIDYTNDNQETVLMKAAAHGHLDVVKKLLEEKRIVLHVNRKDFLSKTALFKAIENGHKDVVKELLKIPNIEINESYHFIAAKKGYLNILNQLLEIQNNESIISNCLNLAIIHAHLDIIKELLLNQKNINNLTRKKQLKVIIPGLLDAAQHGHKEIVKLLLETKADPNIQNDDTNTPLILAAKHGHTDIVKLLLDAGANPNIQSKHIIEDETWLDEYPRRRGPIYRDVQMDWTALHYADNSKNTKMINLLLSAGANPNIKDAHNRAALSETNK